MRAWMVRAERGGRLYDLFKSHSVVALGWHALGSLEGLRSREAILHQVHQTWPDWKPQAAVVAAGQLHRFRNEMRRGDPVLTYDPRRRVYLVGKIAGDYRWDAGLDPKDPNVRPVSWRAEVSRDLLSAASKRSLGAISSLFIVSDEVLRDIEHVLALDTPSA